MEDKNLDIIHRYLNKEIDKDELKKQLSSEDFEYWESTLSLVEDLPKPNFNTQAEFDLLIQKRKSKADFSWKSLYMAAACVLILLGSVITFNYLSSQAEMITITYTEGLEENIHLLPDGSKVCLNKNTSITYNPTKWNSLREIKLDGEAYFDVKKGQKFSVVSKNGCVEVLGTTFNVLNRVNIFEVTCYSGKVAVKHGDKRFVLLPQEAFYSKHSEVVKVDTALPVYMIHWSKFEEKPLAEIIRIISELKNVSINLNVRKTYIYTGGFSNEMTTEQILSLVCETLDLSYTVIEKNHYEIVDASKP